jgi:hypothetical protein
MIHLYILMQFTAEREARHENRPYTEIRIHRERLYFKLKYQWRSKGKVSCS